MDEAKLYKKVWWLPNSLLCSFGFQAQKKEKKKKDAGVEALTTALKALPPDQQMAMLLSKYAELAEDNRHLTVGNFSVIYAVY